MIRLKDEGIYRLNVVRKRPSIQEFVAVPYTIADSATSAVLMKKYGIDCNAVQAEVKRIMKR